jgi:dolichol-phosphate mannosyltransferase
VSSDEADVFQKDHILAGPCGEPGACFIPSYSVIFCQEQRRDYCVVIPVINEGERIRNLLSRMASGHISDIADIIIVDGGSTDHSLEPTQLQELGVRALLLKTGPGKLSAQLQCAYAFALEAGYRGIVTIDGNNKDDPEAIPQMINELKDGVDFVQASRFIRGGYAENTPLLRYIAIRFIHAPLLSICSGFHWSDTTQGFRAYSAKLLLDPRIQPFRRCFVSYELLAYLSYRAPRLGFRCLEIGTSRRYPPGEVPTKISAVRGNLEVLRILAKACLGFYNPSPAKAD